jgi:hypothetical protein
MIYYMYVCGEVVKRTIPGDNSICLEADMIIVNSRVYLIINEDFKWIFNSLIITVLIHKLRTLITTFLSSHVP